MLAEAGVSLDKGVRLAPRSEAARLLRAVVWHRLGDSARAIAACTELLRSRAPNAAEAALALAEMLHRAGLMDDLRQLCAGPHWPADGRGTIFAARIQAESDPVGAARALREYALDGSQPRTPAHRIAGFDAVRLLDMQGEFRQAFDLATELHARTGAPFDIGGMLGELRAQQSLLERGKPWFQPRGPQVRGVALIAGLPRSGTTLLEQMLDGHPSVAGIGEYEGMAELGDALRSRGVWPAQLGLLPQAPDGAQLAAKYADGARGRRRAGKESAAWTLDKSLLIWQWLPAVAAVLPGAVVLGIQRHARDAAISMFLSNFHPLSFGWTATLDDIRRVTQAERAMVPRALQALGLTHRRVKYEELVAQPQQQIRACLEAMGLPEHPDCLAPERNTRTVLTLSHQQVRRPIGTGSIGRWRNYAFAFGAEWDGLE